MLVDGVEASQELLESSAVRVADGGVARVAAADPAPEPERVDGVDAELLDLVQSGRDSNEMLGDSYATGLLGILDGTGGDQTVKQRWAGSRGW